MRTAEEFAERFGWGDGITVASIAALITARDAEHRAELDAAQRTIEQLGKDAATLATENDKYRTALAEGAEEEDRLKGELAMERKAYDETLYRLKGELAEARELLLEIADCESIHPGLHRWILVILAAPPPAESTPVQAGCNCAVADADGECWNCWMTWGHTEPCDHPNHATCAVAQANPCPAPPDDIRERLPSGWLTPPELSMRQDDQARHIADLDKRLAALEAELGKTDVAIAGALTALDQWRVHHRHCRGCGAVLTPANQVVADGCPCNSGRGVNHGLVARNTCTCVVCDPRQTGSTRNVAALEAKGEPPTCYMTECRYYGQRHATPHEPGDLHPKGAKP